MALSDSTNTRGAYNPPKEKTLWGIYYLHKQGVPQCSIIKETGLPRSTVQSIVKRINETNSPLPKVPTGASKKLNERSHRLLQRAIRKDPFVTYNELRLELAATGVHVCKATIISSLKDIGFDSYLPAQKPRLKKQ